MKKWNLNSAIHAYLTCKGLTRCSAIDYLNKNHPNWKQNLNGG